MTGRLAGKVAVVTGAGSRGEGIGNGKAAAVLFAREGASVVCADQVAARAEETVDMIVGRGRHGVGVRVRRVAPRGCQAWPRPRSSATAQIDILQNNVGIPSFQSLEEITEEAWDQVMGVNVRSMVLAAQAAVPHMPGGARLDHQHLVDRRLARVSRRARRPTPPARRRSSA